MTKITFAVIAEMMGYPSLTHFQARKLTPERLAKLTAEERKQRARAQKLLSQRKWRGRATKTFAYPDAPEPTPRDTWRDWLQMDDPKRNILRP